MSNALDVQYVDEIPSTEGYIEIPGESDGGKCPDGRPYSFISYEDEYEPNTFGLVEYYLYPDADEPKIIIFIELGERGYVIEENIYVKNAGKIELYNSLMAFAEAYPRGTCSGRVDQDKL